MRSTSARICARISPIFNADKMAPVKPGAEGLLYEARNGDPRHDAPAFRAGDAFVFGSETSGLPAAVLATLPPAQRLRLPMRPHSRSLNLSNAVAVVVYEAWRQCGFGGAA